jgi:transcriptional regulator with XRE-family HTH domain
MDKRSLIRERREQLRMSTTQLAYRLAVVQSSVVRLEQSEMDESASISSLRRAADALGCDLVYRLVPRNNEKSHQTAYRKPGSKRRVSKVMLSVRQAELDQIGNLSSKQKLRLACQLSDFAWKARAANHKKRY